VFMSDEEVHEVFGVPPPDPTIKQTTEILGLSPRKIYRLIKAGQLISYLCGGKRRVSLVSIKFYVDRCRNAGPQLSIPLVTGKRRVGRPPKTEAQPSAAE
jgi:excisionase family DNA binding protein